MRILTVRQPWAWAIAHGGKDVENRTRSIAGSYRGPVAIHAGKDLDGPAWSEVERLSGQRWREDDDIRGAIIGVADLVDVHHSTACPIYVDDAPWPLCSRWSLRDSWHITLATPRSLPEPIPYKGALGLRELPADVEALIWEQVQR